MHIVYGVGEESELRFCAAVSWEKSPKLKVRRRKNGRAEATVKR
jgi:hypothetical protein